MTRKKSLINFRRRRLHEHLPADRFPAQHLQHRRPHGVQRQQQQPQRQHQRQPSEMGHLQGAVESARARIVAEDGKEKNRLSMDACRVAESALN